MTGYCEISLGHPYHGPYHDLEYGFPVFDDNVLFERLILEINQAGLSWLTVLKKRKAFKLAYDHFDIERVAAYGDVDRKRLLNNSGIIRNKRKIEAAIANAERIMLLKSQYDSFNDWLKVNHPRDKLSWVKLFKDTFVFTGSEITNEFLLSTGYLPGAHCSSCPVYKKIARLNPPYLW
ncbi:MAG: DNA-3-methyladenine glycosylase [Rhodospirillaceae bacterium]|nr:DNA-3-methyladenine glycosylase [Rhodospirillaceae bacterium]